MYDFLLRQWQNKNVTAEELQSMVPRWITQEECNSILGMPQLEPVETAVDSQNELL